MFVHSFPHSSWQMKDFFSWIVFFNRLHGWFICLLTTNMPLGFTNGFFHFQKVFLLTKPSFTRFFPTDHFFSLFKKTIISSQMFYLFTWFLGFFFTLKDLFWGIFSWICIVVFWADNRLLLYCFILQLPCRDIVDM